jgi:hypothetical protein
MSGGMLRLLGEDLGHRGEVKHQLTEARAELTRARSDATTAQAKVVKAVADSAVTELARQAVVEELASVKRDLNRKRSKARLLSVHVERVATMAVAITGSRWCHLTVLMTP